MKNLLLISLGSNLGDKLFFLRSGKKNLINNIGGFLAESPVFETEPFGVDHNSSYLNQVLAFQTQLSPFEILSITSAIEIECGRTHKRDLKPRTLDIDLLSVGNEIIETPNLILPHPRIQIRRFVLTPLEEICPGWIHPVYKLSPSEMNKQLDDKSWIKKWNPAPELP
jgi:2-amino-4-hydroxy-6-hydroxymethyldihydropteridine diphosphokinase